VIESFVLYYLLFKYRIQAESNLY